MDVDRPSSTGDAFKSAVGKGVSKYDGGAGGRKGAGADFELEDYWDDGAPLKNREALPVCVTLNLVSLKSCRVFYDSYWIDIHSISSCLRFISSTQRLSKARASPPDFTLHSPSHHLPNASSRTRE